MLNRIYYPFVLFLALMSAFCYPDTYMDRLLFIIQILFIVAPPMIGLMVHSRLKLKIFDKVLELNATQDEIGKINAYFMSLDDKGKDHYRITAFGRVGYTYIDDFLTDYERNKRNKFSTSLISDDQNKLLEDIIR